MITALIAAVLVFAAVAGWMCLAAHRNGADADHWRAQANTAAQERTQARIAAEQQRHAAAQWQAAYEYVRRQQLEGDGVPEADVLLDLAMTSTTYDLYQELEQQR